MPSIDKVKGNMFDPRTNRKMAWVHFNERQRTTSILSTIEEHNASVPASLQIRLAGTNDDEHIITSVGRKRLQSHPYYQQIVKKDDTYWEFDGQDDNPREMKKLKLDHVVNVQPASVKRASIQVVHFEPPQKRVCGPRLLVEPIMVALPMNEPLVRAAAPVEPAPVEPFAAEPAPAQPLVEPAEPAVEPMMALFHAMKAIVSAKDEIIALQKASSALQKASSDATIAAKDATIAAKDETIEAKQEVIGMQIMLIEDRRQF